MKRIAVAFIGHSGAGKTTIIRRLISRFAASDITVSVLKNTHHPLNHENRGDTAAFLAAGAVSAILASRGRGVLFYPDGRSPEDLEYQLPEELVVRSPGTVVLAEGFKSVAGWPKLLVDREGVTSPTIPLSELAGVISDRLRRPGLTLFSHDDIAELAQFVDRISRDGS